MLASVKFELFIKKSLVDDNKKCQSYNSIRTHKMSLEY